MSASNSTGVSDRPGAARPGSVIDELVDNARSYAESFDQGHLPLPPARKLAVLACMDSRMDIFGLLGLPVGEAHIIRNAGGVVTADVIRSLALSQRRMGTEAIMLIHHTECGMELVSDEEFRASLQDELGVEPPWSVPTFKDLAQDVRESIARIKDSPFIPKTDDVRGFVFDVKTGELSEIT